MELKLTIDEVNLILQGLYELPAKMSYNLISNIRRQADAYLQHEAEYNE